MCGQEFLVLTTVIVLGEFAFLANSGSPKKPP